MISRAACALLVTLALSRGSQATRAVGFDDMTLFMKAGVVPAVVSNSIDAALEDAETAQEKAEAEAMDAESKYAEHKESTEEQEQALAAAQTEQANLMEASTQMAEAATKQVAAIASKQKGADSYAKAAEAAADAKKAANEADKKQRDFEQEMFKLISEKKKELLKLKEDYNDKLLQAKGTAVAEERARLEAEAVGEVAASASKMAAELGTKVAEAEMKVLEAEKTVGTATTKLEYATMAAAQAQSTLADTTAQAAAKKEVFEMLLMLEEVINKFYNDVDSFMDAFKKVTRSGGTHAPHEEASTKLMLVSNNKMVLVYNRLVVISKTHAEMILPGIGEVNKNANASINRHCKPAKGHKCGLDLYRVLGLEKANLVTR